MHRILQPTRAYLDSKVNTLIGFFFHPERIRQHAMQTLNSSIRTSPLTVNFILSAFTWPIEQLTALQEGTHCLSWYMDTSHKHVWSSDKKDNYKYSLSIHILLIDECSPIHFKSICLPMWQIICSSIVFL